MKHQNKLRLAWFGLDIRETERYLSKRDALYDSEAEQLEALIQSEKALNKKLRQELDQKTALLNANKHNRPDEFADLLLQRLDDSVEALRKQGEAERQRLLALMETKRTEQGSKRADMDKQLAEYQVAFDQLLAEAARLLANLKDKPEQDKPEVIEEEIVSFSAEIQGPVELAEEENEELAEDVKMEQNLQGESEFAYGANVVRFRQKSVLDSLEESESEQTMVTADGAAPPAVMRDQAFKNEPAPKQVETALRMKHETASSIVPDVQASASGFWGDVSLYMEGGNEKTEGSAASPPPEAPPVIAMASERLTAAAQHELAEAEAASSAVDPSPRIPNPNASHASSAASAEPETSAVSPALAEEIKSIQYRYIAGKAAGENLYGEDGSLIIAKGGIITTDTIKRAERAGKMPDLIVQMVIPGFAEPS